MPRPAPANNWTVKPMAAGCRLYSGTALPSGIHCKRGRDGHGSPRVKALADGEIYVLRIGVASKSA